MQLTWKRWLIILLLCGSDTAKIFFSLSFPNSTTRVPVENCLAGVKPFEFLHIYMAEYYIFGLPFSENYLHELFVEQTDYFTLSRADAR